MVAVSLKKKRKKEKEKKRKKKKAQGTDHKVIGGLDNKTTRAGR